MRPLASCVSRMSSGPRAAAGSRNRLCKYRSDNRPDISLFFKNH